MRKFYSLVLIAAGLLIGTNVWAAVNQVTVTYNSGSYAENPKTFGSLQAAINSIQPGDTATIVLDGDQKLTQAVCIPQVIAPITASNPNILNRTGQRICLDLNGHNITEADGVAEAIGIFQFLKGTLHLTGIGSIEHTKNTGSGNPKRSAIFIGGAPATQKRTVWTKLIIDKDVFVNATGANDATGKNYAITIDACGNNAAMPAMMADDGNTTMNTIAGYKTNVTSTGAKGSYVYRFYDDKITCRDHNTAGCAYGVRVYINGATLYGNQRAINIGGNINAAPACDEDWTGSDPKYRYRRYPNAVVDDTHFYYDNFYPYIKITSGTKLLCRGDGLKSGNGGIYGGGYCVYDIDGAEISGQSGVFVKSGDMIVTDSHIESVSSLAQTSGNYGENVGGSAVFIASDDGYAGDVKITVTGGTTLVGGGEAAIVDGIAENRDETQVTRITIEGGTVVTGDNGAILLTDKTGNETVVTGGNIQGDIELGGTQVNVEDLIPEGYHTTVIEDTDGNKVVAVSEGDAPVAGNKVSNQAENASVKWVGSTYVEDEILANQYLKLAELEINDYVDETTPRAQTLYVRDGATLEVGRVVLGTAAQIIVEAGGKLIVTGKDGIAAIADNNIVLKTEEGKPSYFILNPAVVTNRNPQAAVELLSKSYRNAGKNVYQRFGIPNILDAYHGVTMEYKDNTSSTLTYIKNWDYSADAWAPTWTAVPAASALDINSDLKPFYCFDLASNNAKADPMTYVFKGALVGNTDAKMSFNAGFNPYANSYMAPIDIESLINRLADTYPELEASINVYQAAANDNYTWRGIGQADFGEFGPLPGMITTIEPMQAYVLKLKTGSSYQATISYKDNVYDPFMPAAPAPARKQAKKQNFTVLGIANENGVVNDYARLIEDARFSEDFDNGYDISKFMNDNVNLYVNAEEALSTMASDDIQNTYIGVSVAESGVYTLTIGHNGLDYALVDLENNQIIDLVEGNTYEFFQEAGKNDARFEIVKVNKMPTSLEDINENQVVSTKIMKDGVMYILKNGAVYNAQGQIIK